MLFFDNAFLISIENYPFLTLLVPDRTQHQEATLTIGSIYSLCLYLLFSLLAFVCQHCKSPLKSCRKQFLKFCPAVILSHRNHFAILCKCDIPCTSADRWARVIPKTSKTKQISCRDWSMGRPITIYQEVFHLGMNHLLIIFYHCTQPASIIWVALFTQFGNPWLKFHFVQWAYMWAKTLSLSFCMLQYFAINLWSHG